jgi:hypothetical protein
MLCLCTVTTIPRREPPYGPPPPSETITPSSLPSSFLRLPPPSSPLERHSEVRRPGRGGQCSCHAGSSGVEQDVVDNHFGRRSRVWPSFSRSCLPSFIDEIDVQPPARDTGFTSYAICRWESSSMYRYVPHANEHSPGLISSFKTSKARVCKYL